MLTKREFTVLLEKYRESIEEYLTLYKDKGFEFMEELVAEIEDEEELDWTDAYEMFNRMVDAVVMSKVRK